MRSLSKINKNITIDFLREPENLYFDRKSANTDLKKIANEVASFANANGGVVAVGLNDNGEIEGFNYVGIDKLNETQKIVGSYLKPAPICQIELVDVKNKK